MSLKNCFSYAGVLPFDCLDIYNGKIRGTGVYEIFPTQDIDKPVKVVCDMDLLGGGWTVGYLSVCVCLPTYPPTPNNNLYISLNPILFQNLIVNQSISKYYDLCFIRQIKNYIPIKQLLIQEWRNIHCFQWIPTNNYFLSAFTPFILIE